MSNATLSFLPWVRQGAASAIDVTDAQQQSPVAAIAVNLSLNGTAVQALGGSGTNLAVALRGPADVIGIDANQVVRTEPRPGTADFESNCFPSIEFDRPDFPWLFTPARADTDHRLRPWLCLVVVRKQPGVALASPPTAPLPILTIEAPAVPANELPDLRDSWAWAHAQVAATNSVSDTADATRQAVDAAFGAGPEHTLSRLVCPRFLDARTDYIACVVPAFEVGRRAGIGLPVSPADEPAAWNLAPAWSVVQEPPATRVELPVYYHWEFRTGEQGDFESLARGLTVASPEGVGRRTIDVSQPGFAGGGAAALEIEGALVPATVDGETDPIPAAFKANLASILNQPGQTAAAHDGSDPILAPPMYGRWHAGVAEVDPQRASWLDQLNLDPRWRVAAALGTRVVQQHQEALMASAWEQAAQLRAANQRLRQIQVSLAVAEVIHARHFGSPAVTDEMMIRLAAPAFGRLQPDGSSLLAQQMGTGLPLGANRVAMRRIARQRGPVTRRVASKGSFARSASETWVARLNRTWAPGNDPIPAPTPPAKVWAVPGAMTQWARALAYTATGDPNSYFGAFFVAPEGATVIPPGTQALQQRVEAPDFFRSAARELLGRLFPSRPAAAETGFVSFTNVKDLVLESTQPRAALSSLASAIITTGDGVLAPTAPGVASTGVETVMAAPHFAQPMYETLRDLSQELLLPGLDRIAPESVLGLSTNRRFVEAFMVGLNHEFGRELLWRGYPTDQRGTYFDRFWGHGTPNVAPADITALHTWSARDAGGALRQLGDTAGAPDVAEEFVLVMRSSLLRRYPNAVIYLTPAVRAGAGAPDPDAMLPSTDPAMQQAPLFSGSMQPDVVFFGFPVSATAARGGDGGDGYYVVIQEHPTEPRFGVDDDFTVATSYLSVTPQAPAGLDLQGGTWNDNAAQMALITRRLPTRLAIHAARLISPA